MEINIIKGNNKKAIIFIMPIIILGMYLVCVVYNWEFFYFLTLFCLLVLVTALLKFETAFLFIPLTLTNPYALTETGTNLHISELVLIIIFIVWLGRLILLREHIVFPKQFLIPSIILIISAILSLLGARYYVAGIQQIIRYIEIMLIFFMVVLYSCTDEKRIREIFLFLIIGGLIASCVGLGQFIYYVFQVRQSQRIFGWHGGGYGALIASTIILSVSALTDKKDRIMKIWAIITIPIAGLALIVSQTRAWIIALVLVLGLMFVLQKRSYGRKILMALGLVFGIFIILLQTDAFGLIDSRFIIDAIRGAFRFGTSPTEKSATDLSMLLRLRAWNEGIIQYLSHPFSGIGAGNLRFIDYFTLRLGKPVEGAGYVDNQYIQFFAEIGTIGGIAWIAYITQAVRTGINSVRGAVGSNLFIPAFGSFGSVLIFVIGSFFWVVTPQHELFALIILYIGLLYRIKELTESRQPTES
jgi:O-antigen ligase